MKIEEGTTTPLVNLSMDEGVIEIKGKSIPENAVRFYEPVLSWLDNYFKAPLPETKFMLEMEYFNTSTSGLFLKMLNRASKEANHTKIKVDWIVNNNDEDMIEAGEDFALIVRDVQFNIVNR